MFKHIINIDKILKVRIIDNYNIGLNSNKFDHIIDKDIFLENGIEIVLKLRECDVIICCRIDCEIIHSKKPVILCERFDSCSIGSSKHYYSYKNVIAVFKDFIPRDNSILSSETIKKRYHYKVLNDIYGTSPEETENNKDNEKYSHLFKQVSWGIEQYSHLDINKHMLYCKENTMDKTNDIFCVSHANHGEPIASHRTNLKNEIKNMDNITSIVGENLKSK